MLQKWPRRRRLRLTHSPVKPREPRSHPQERRSQWITPPLFWTGGMTYGISPPYLPNCESEYDILSNRIRSFFREGQIKLLL